MSIDGVNVNEFVVLRTGSLQRSGAGGKKPIK